MDTHPPPSLQLDDPAEHADELLAYCDAIFTTACNAAFKRPKSAMTTLSRLDIRTATTDDLGHRIQALGKMKNAARNGTLPLLLSIWPPARQELRHVLQGDSFHAVAPADLMTRLNRERSQIRKQLNAERRKALSEAVDARAVTDLKTVLKTGKVNVLFPHESPPVPDMFQTVDETGASKLAITAEGRKQAWDTYFQQLYHRPPLVAPESKPWIESTASETMQQRTAGDKDFVWPRTIDEVSLRSLILRGNPKPSPGPDGWERWALRRASDRFLLLVSDIINYTVHTNYFPDALKMNWIVPLPKPKDDLSDMKNWRGIVHANCLYNTITSWFSGAFQSWVWERKLLAPTQVATQQGVQISDLSSFLEQVDTAAHLSQTTVLAIKRDHIKGFDYLHESAYYDCLRFFGVNPAVADFERARTQDIKLRVRTTDGPGDGVITTTGQTKQGDPLSPLKYTLVMSMFYHWVSLNRNLARRTLTLATITAAQGRYHLPIDKYKLEVVSVEAMDDSILFASSWPALRTLVKLSEVFQRAYGITTAWDSEDKTVCFALGRRPEPSPDQVTFLDATNEEHSVPFTARPQMLRSAIADSAATATEIAAIIDRFAIPKGAGPRGTDLPLSVIKRAVSSLLMSKVRSKLQLQPVSLAMATDLDQRISRKITDAIGVRHTATDILSLPVSYLGFGFPSIVQINGQVAIDRVLRAMNHHLAPFRTMGEITMANWQCHGNHCAPPFEIEPNFDTPQTGGKRKVASSGHWSPVSWKIAQDYTRMTGLTIIQTDQSHYTSSPATHNIRRAHVTNARQHPGVVELYRAHRDDFRLKTLPEVVEALRRYPAHGTSQLNGKNSLRALSLPGAFVTTEPSVFQTRASRKAQYNATVSRAFRNTPENGAEPLFASDGSHKTLYKQFASTTAAVVGPSTASFTFTGQFSSSMHAERLGLVGALIQAQKTIARDPTDSSPITILTDHLNSVRDVARVRQDGYQNDSWRPRPGHEMYSWLVKAIQHTPRQVHIKHVKAHTGLSDVESQLNDRADMEARLAHHEPAATVLPPLTGWMRPYVVYVADVGYCADNWQAHYIEAIQKCLFDVQKPKLKTRLQNFGNKVPDYFYSRSPSGSTAKFQLILRTGTFVTESLISRGNPEHRLTCRSCGRNETEAHIFLWCPEYAAFRTEAVAKAMKLWRSADRGGADPDRERPAEADVKTYLEGHLKGLAGHTYWTGRTCRLPPGMSNLEAAIAHNMCITLTSRIAGFRARAPRTATGASEDELGPRCVTQ